MTHNLMSHAALHWEE